MRKQREEVPVLVPWPEPSPCRWRRWSAGVALLGCLLAAGAGGSLPRASAQDVDGLEEIRQLAGADDPRVGVEELQKLRVAALQREQGRYEDSLNSYRAVYGGLKGELQQDDHPLLLEILLMVTDVFLEMEQFQQAEGPLMKQLDLRELKLVRQNLTAVERAVEEAKVAASRVKQGLILSRIGRPEDALEPLSQGGETLERLIGSGHRLVLESKLLAARIAWSLGRFAEATDRTEQLVAELVKAEGIDAQLLEQAREDLGAMYLETGRVTAAIQLWDRELADLEARLRPDSPKLIVAYRRLGEAYAAGGDYEGAEEYWGKSLKVSQAAFPGTSGEVAADLTAVGIAQELLDKRVGAINAFDQATATFEAAAQAGVVSGNQTRFVRRAVESLLVEGHNERAARLFEMAMLADQSRTDRNEVDVAEDKVGIARCLLAVGDMASAEVFLRQALATIQRESGNRHIRTLEVVGLLAQAAAKRGDFELGSSLIDVLCKAAPPRRLGVKETDLVEAIATICLLLERNELTNRASDIQNRWLAMRESQYGADGVELVDSLVAFADAFQAAGMSERAIPLYERAVALREQATRADHPSVAAVLLPLARAFRGQQREAEAAEAARRALAIWDEAVGPDHEVSEVTVKMLAAAVYAEGKKAEAAPLYARMLRTYEREYGPEAPQIALLLGRLAEVTVAAGNPAAAEAYLNRAIEINARTATGSSTAMAANLAELAKIERSLGKGDGSKYLERARELAKQAGSEQEQSDILASIADASAATPSSRPGPEMAAVDRQTAASATQDPAEDLLAIARKLERGGNRNGAQAAIEQAITDARRRHGESDPIVGRLSVALGDVLLRQGNVAEAFGVYQQAVALLVATVGEDDTRSVVAAMRLAAPMQINGDLIDARSMLSLALGRLRNVPPEFGKLAVEGLRVAADYTLAVGDDTTAISLLERLAAVEGAIGQPAAVTYEDLAAAYERSGTAARAQPLREKLLTAAAGEGGEPQPSARLGRRHYDLAFTAMLSEDLRLAEKHARDAIRIDEQAGGKEHPAVARDLLLLAAVCRQAGRANDATAALNLARSIAGAAVAAARIENTGVLRELAEACRRSNDLQAAGRILETALGADLQTRGRGHLETAADHLALATVRRLEGDFDRAGKNYERVVSIYGLADGPGAPRTTAAQTLLNDMLRNGNRNFGRDGLLPLEARQTDDQPVNLKAAASAYTDLLQQYAAAKSPAVVGRGGGPLATPGGATTADSAEKAKRMLNAVTGVFGGGSGRAAGGIDALVSYTDMLGQMNAADDGGLSALEAGRQQIAAAAAGIASQEPAGLATGGAGGPVTLRLPATGGAEITLLPGPGLVPSAAAVAETGSAGDSAADATETINDLIREGWRRHLAGDVPGAEAVLRRAIELAEESEGPAAAVTLDAVAQLSTILLEAGRLTAARDQLEQLLARRATVAGADDPATLGTKMLLADLLVETGDWADAWPLAVEFLGRTEPLADTISFERAEALLRVATVELGVGRTATAWQRVQRARQILGTLFAAAYGRGVGTEAGREFAATISGKEVRFFRAVTTLCKLHGGCGDIIRGSGILNKLLETTAAVDQAAPLDLERALAVAVDLAVARGDSLAAESAARRVVEIRQTAFGSFDPRTTVMEARLQDLRQVRETEPNAVANRERFAASLKRLQDNLEPIGAAEASVWLLPVMTELLEQAMPLGDPAADVVGTASVVIERLEANEGSLPVSAAAMQLLAKLAACADPADSRRFSEHAAGLRAEVLPALLETDRSFETACRLGQGQALAAWGRRGDAEQLVLLAAGGVMPAEGGDKRSGLEAFDRLLAQESANGDELFNNRVITARRYFAEREAREVIPSTSPESRAEAPAASVPSAAAVAPATLTGG